ncbi:hypothetical protein AgCh_011525 [Apium graveolens]
MIVDLSIHSIYAAAGLYAQKWEGDVTVVMPATIAQLLDYGLDYSAIPIYCDNSSDIAMTGNPVQHSMTKHISIRYHFIREHVKAAYEAAGSHTAPISNSILHAEAGDEVQQLVQNPVVIEESNDGEEAHISNVIIDPEDDLFFPEDMPTHVRQHKLKELDAKNT